MPCFIILLALGILGVLGGEVRVEGIGVERSGVAKSLGGGCGLLLAFLGG